jgi:hypothetical protein
MEIMPITSSWKWELADWMRRREKGEMRAKGRANRFKAAN